MDGNYQTVYGGFNAQGQYAQTVYYWTVTGSSSMDEYQTCNALNNAFSTTIVPKILPTLSDFITLNILYSKKVDGLGGAAIFKDTFDVGTGGANAISNAVAIDMAFYPGGAKNRPGHKFWWGIDASGLIGDIIQSAMLTLLNTLGSALLAGLTLTGGGTAAYGTWTRKTKTVTPATHFNVKPKLTGLNKRTKPLY